MAAPLGTSRLRWTAAGELEEEEWWHCRDLLRHGCLHALEGEGAEAEMGTPSDYGQGILGLPISWKIYGQEWADPKTQKSIV